MSNADYTILHTLPMSRLREFAQHPSNRRLLRAYLMRRRALVQAGVWRAIAKL